MSLCSLPCAWLCSKDRETRFTCLALSLDQQTLFVGCRADYEHEKDEHGPVVSKINLQTQEVTHLIQDEYDTMVMAMSSDGKWLYVVDDFNCDAMYRIDLTNRDDKSDAWGGKILQWGTRDICLTARDECVCVTAGHSITFWDTKTFVDIEGFYPDRHNEFHHAMAITLSPDRETVYYAYAYMGISTYIPSTRTQKTLVQTLESPLKALGCSPDHQWLYGLCADGGLDVWQCSTGRHMAHIPTPYTPPFWASQLVVSPDGHVLYIPIGTNLWMYDVCAGEWITFDMGCHVDQMCLSDNGQRIYMACSGSGDSHVCVLDCTTFVELGWVRDVEALLSVSDQ